MTFAGVADIEVRRPGTPGVFKYSVGQLLDFGGVTRCIVAIDYHEGALVIGSRIVWRTVWQRLRAAWRVLRGGIG